MKKLKVFGGCQIVNRDGRSEMMRVICAAYTKKQAIEILGDMSANYFSKYWCETGNARELAVAVEVGSWAMRDKNDRDIEPIRLDKFTE